MTATARSVELRAVAQRIADALPAAVEEVVLTGSVSRGVADDVSDIEMLIVTPGEPELDECFALAAACGLTDLGTWGRQGEPTKRVSGYREGVPIELIWWSRRARRDGGRRDLRGRALTRRPTRWPTASPCARPGCWREWQERLRDYPDELAGAGSRTRRSPGAGSRRPGS